MGTRIKPCKWATGALDAIQLEWGKRSIVYRRCCECKVPGVPDTGPCVYCQENWLRADSTAKDELCHAYITCRAAYSAASLTLNRITPEPKVS